MSRSLVALLLVPPVVFGACATGREVVFPTGGGPVVAHLSVLPDEVGPEEQAAYAHLRGSDENPDLLLRAALFASGVADPAEVSRYERLARQQYEALLPAINAEREPFQRARVLLEAMHGSVLRAYSFHQAYVQVLLDTGVYDCVSSAVLYNVYAGWLGIQTGAALQTGHAFSRVTIAGRPIEVETTTKAGFDPLLSPEEYRDFLAQRGLPADTRVATRFVSSRALLGQILVHRMKVESEAPVPDDSRLRAALAVTRRMVSLAPEDRVADRNEAVLLENLGVHLVQGGREGEGLELLLAALKESPPDNAEHVRKNLEWAAGLRVFHLGPADDEGIGLLLERVRQAFDCAAHPGACGELDQAAVNQLWNAAIQAEQAGQLDTAWAITEKVLKRFPSAVGSDNHIHFAMAESGRRWATDHEAGDAWLQGTLTRLACETRKGAGCSALATNATARWFKLDSTKALAWARLAMAWDSSEKVVRSNFRNGMWNEIVRLMNRRECGEVQKLVEELKRYDAFDAEIAELAGRCRSRTGETSRDIPQTRFPRPRTG